VTELGLGHARGRDDGEAVDGLNRSGSELILADSIRASIHSARALRLGGTGGPEGRVDGGHQREKSSGGEPTEISRNS